METPVHYVPPVDLAQADLELGTKITEWVKAVYWVLILVVIGGMFIHNLVIVSWYVGKKWREEHETPARRRFNSAQIVQHAALFTSFFVLVLTGLILWFPILATSFLPGWSVKVAEVVHLFEAWLATLAILVFHFFYVFGHPEVSPLNLAMFTGRMREDVAKHHHPAWEEEAAREGRGFPAGAGSRR